MIVVRRTYRCKTGHAGPATELFREVARITRDADPSAGAIRVYTDLSGATDRVVMETERASFDHPRDISALVHEHPEAQGIFGQLVEHLAGSEVEFLQLEHCL